MHMQVIGPYPFARDEMGRPRTVIGTVFPEAQTLYTDGPAVHACQRAGFAEHLNKQRAAKGLAPLTEEEEDGLCRKSVDLIFEPDLILIRPDPERMELAFAADDLLQELASKRQIKFLMLSDARVREAIKRRGENWRLSSLPKTTEGKREMVFSSKVAIHGLPIYFYNRLTGTRWLTCQSFGELAGLSSTALGMHLAEIAEHATRKNRLGSPEVAFFAADFQQFGPGHFNGGKFDGLPEEELRGKYRELAERFRSAVLEAYRKDDCQQNAWSKRMVSTLFLDGNDAQNEQIHNGLSQEFFLELEWLPGGRFEDGEFIPDPIFEEAGAHPENSALCKLCDLRAMGIIFNLVREFGDLEYINVARVPESLSLDRPLRRGRRGVFIVELKSRSEAQPIKRFVRLQKWGVWEHLDEGKDLLRSIEESEEYSDYWLDRRLGCRQLGMNLTRRVVMRRLSEVYRGAQARYSGQTIRTSYFEREYLPGVATDKLPAEKYSKAGYALKLARLLGQAAGSSLIVGRALEQGTRPVFDDGDEVVVEGEDGLPAEILLGDHSGAFGEYKLPFENFAAHYARPVNVRVRFVPQAAEFAETYLAALKEQLLHIQSDYRKRRRAFDTLFKHCRYDAAGSFAYRWERVLRRLEEAKVETLVEAIRGHIRLGKT
jgi:hypothetical protein